MAVYMILWNIFVKLKNIMKLTVAPNVIEQRGEIKGWAQGLVSPAQVLHNLKATMGAWKEALISYRCSAETTKNQM